MSDDDLEGWGWIGWDLAGSVEKLGPEGISTSFFWVVIPVRAGKSFYCFRTAEGADGRFEIPRHRRSVALGYLRTPLWFAATIVTAGGLLAFDRWAHLLPIGLGLAAVASVLTFVLGRLDPGEHDRRALLRRVTGLGAPPELLPPSILEDMRDQLADAWFREHHTNWRDAIERGAASETLVALAEYYKAPQLLIRARTNLIAAEGN